ncbi:hypothetical protein Dip518_000208 [Parelusimicrobium proximum]|uniref:hypothetical protein n=1 Tax=Parelusimicrobium proximum TaxID=3228953 RepID=UPI003D170E0D
MKKLLAIVFCLFAVLPAAAQTRGQNIEADVQAYPKVTLARAFNITPSKFTFLYTEAVFATPGIFLSKTSEADQQKAAEKFINACIRAAEEGGVNEPSFSVLQAASALSKDGWEYAVKYAEGRNISSYAKGAVCNVYAALYRESQKANTEKYYGLIEQGNAFEAYIILRNYAANETIAQDFSVSQTLEKWAREYEKDVESYNLKMLSITLEDALQYPKSGFVVIDRQGLMAEKAGVFVNSRNIADQDKAADDFIQEVILWKGTGSASLTAPLIKKMEKLNLEGWVKVLDTADKYNLDFKHKKNIGFLWTLAYQVSQDTNERALKHALNKGYQEQIESIKQYYFANEVILAFSEILPRVQKWLEEEKNQKISKKDIKQKSKNMQHYKI